VVDLAIAHVNALQYLLKNTEHAFYDWVNLGTGSGKSVLEVVHAFEKVSGQSLKYEFAPRRPGDVTRIFASTDKAGSMLGWKTERSLEQALEDAWRWQKNL
jgi:UDP-glucose 4-epimerase